MSARNTIFLLTIFILFHVSNGFGWDNQTFINKINLSSLEQSNFQQNRSQFKITLNDQWFSKDKMDHLLVSTFLTVGGYYFLQREQNHSHQTSTHFSLAFAFSMGMAKEIRDGFQKHNAASVKDLVADILGIGMGFMLFNQD